MAPIPMPVLLTFVATFACGMFFSPLLAVIAGVIAFAISDGEIRPKAAGAGFLTAAALNTYFLFGMGVLPVWLPLA